MITVFSDKHRLRNAKTELYGGQLVAPFESPSRADIVLERVKSEKLGQVIDRVSYTHLPLPTICSV